MTIRGKTIVVTGAASGIGAATAHLLKVEGARVIAVDQEPPDQNADEFVHIDLADEASINAAAKAIAGPVDGLCNIAGVPPTVGEAATLGINFVGLRSFTDKLLNRMGEGSAVVSASSGAGDNWRDNMVIIKKCLALTSDTDLVSFCEENQITGARAYMLSKEVLNVWTLLMAIEWKSRGVRFNAVCPGPVRTPILPDFVDSFGERANASMEMAGVAEAEDIAPLIVFLLSDNSRWINGSLVPVDNSLLAQKLVAAHDL